MKTFLGLVTFCICLCMNLNGDNEICSLIKQLSKYSEPLVLSENETEKQVTLKGTLLQKVQIEENGDTIPYWTLKMDDDSFIKAIKTPVAMAFQSPKDIMISKASYEVQLTHDRDACFQNNVNKNVTVEGVLFHAHTSHHYTPIQMIVQKIVNSDI